VKQNNEQSSAKPPDHASVKQFYDTDYYAEEHAERGPPRHLLAIARRLGDLHGKTALDVACGTGQWLQLLGGRGATLAGIDISEAAVARCKTRLPAAEVHQGVAEQLPFADARFDLVTCMGSLEHFLDQPAALAEMLRVARGDARFLILVPNAGFLTRRLGLYRGTQQAAVRETVLSIETWNALFENAGLRVVAKWRDLHPLSIDWIMRGSWLLRPVRFLQALALTLWPVSWQYQVYFLCVRQAGRA